MKITDGKRTVEVHTVLINNFGSGDISTDLLVDGTMTYDGANDLFHVQSVQDVLDYCQEWEDEDPDNRYFDWEELHDER